jgi:PDZ domain
MSAKSNKPRVRYLTVNEMLQRIQELRAKREQGGRDSEPAQEIDDSWYPDRVAHYERWLAHHGRKGPDAQPESDTPVPSAIVPIEDSADLLLSEERFVWVGDDLAVRLEASEADAFEGSQIDAIDDADEIAAVPVIAQASELAARRFHMPRWSIPSYAMGAGALGVIAMVAVGTLLALTPGRPTDSLMAALAHLRAGSAPAVELAQEDQLAPLPLASDAAADATASHRRFLPQRAEEKIRQALARRGFLDVGISAGRRGDVYLAGDVYSLNEARYIVRVARRAAGTANVHFLHPDVRSPVGPAYFGVITKQSPATWGAEVSGVVIGSPAYKVGIRTGDVIRGFDHKVIADARTLDQVRTGYHPGDRVDVRIWRGGRDYSVVVRLGELTEMASR